MSDAMKVLEALELLFRNEKICEIKITKKFEHQGSKSKSRLRCALEVKIGDLKKPKHWVEAPFFLCQKDFDSGEEAIRALAIEVRDRLKAEANV